MWIFLTKLSFPLELFDGDLESERERQRACHTSGLEFLSMAFYNFCCVNAYLFAVGELGGNAQCPFVAFCHRPSVCGEGDLLRLQVYVTLCLGWYWQTQLFLL